jgi:hypothetical protein
VGRVQTPPKWQFVRDQKTVLVALIVVLVLAIVTVILLSVV